jgi:hypothetical protein
MKIRFFALLLLLLMSGLSYGADEDCVLVDGPANLRDGPNGKVIRSLPNDSSVQKIKSDGKWVLINSFAKKTTVRCYDNFDENGVNGWIHQSNLRPFSESKLFKAAPCDAMWGMVSRESVDKKLARKEATIKKKTCDCGSIYWSPTDRSSCEIKTLTSGELLGQSCVVLREFIRCRSQLPEAVGGDRSDLVCPLECVDLKAISSVGSAPTE